MSLATQTIILKPGESFSLPAGAELKFASDPTGLASDCGTPPPTSYQCGYFLYVVNEGDDDHPFDSNFCDITKLYVSDLTFDINLHADGLADGTGSLPALNANIPESIFKFTFVGKITYARRRYIVLYFRAASIYFDDMELEIDERDDSASAPNPLLMYSKPTAYNCDQYDVNF